MEADLAGTVVPYVAAAAGAYGAAVLERLRDTATDTTADAAVGLGRRLLAVILRRRDVTSADPVAAAVNDLALEPADPDAAAALRLQLRKVLEADPVLAAAVKDPLDQADASISASGDGAVAVRDNWGIIQTGLGSRATQSFR